MTKPATTIETRVAIRAAASQFVCVEARPASPVLGGRMPWPVAGPAGRRAGRGGGCRRHDGHAALDRHLDGDRGGGEQAAEQVGGVTVCKELARDAAATTGGDNNFVLADVRSRGQQVEGDLATEGLSNRAGDRGDQAAWPATAPVPASTPPALVTASTNVWSETGWPIASFTSTVIVAFSPQVRVDGAAVTVTPLAAGAQQR